MNLNCTRNDSAACLSPTVPPLPLWAVLTAAVLCSAVVAGALANNLGWIGVVTIVIADLPTAVLIFLAGGGWGWLGLHKMMPGHADPGLRAATYTGLGLWLLGTLMFMAGSLTGAGLRGALWWPAVLIGAGLAVWKSRPWWRSLDFLQQPDLNLILPLLFGTAIGLWLVGAAMPPDVIGNRIGDFYDVVSYHLQIPREFYDAGRITFLPHNTYSNYPLGAHMLYLLSMTLRGGGFAGAYTAGLTHGLWGILAVATLWSAQTGPKAGRRRITAALLLATMPGIIYVSWLAFVELSQVAYMAMGLLWLRSWLTEPRERRQTALMIGMICGAACATKYLSVGFVAGPLLFIMAVQVIKQPRRFTELLLAGAAAALLFAPWLLRNLINTGNPVFPLVTEWFGAGHWPAEAAERWNAAHAPPGWNRRPGRLIEVLMGGSLFGPLLVIAAVSRGASRFFRRLRPLSQLDRLALAVLGLQIVVWALATHMADRFLLPASVPVALLAGSAFEQLSGPRNRPPQARNRKFLGNGLCLIAVLLNLGTAGRLYLLEPYTRFGLHGYSPSEMQEILGGLDWVQDNIGPRGKLLAIGDPRAFTLPDDTVYASIWEADPLVQGLRAGMTPEEVLGHLRREYAITHLLIHWQEIARIRHTYGWWDEFSDELFAALVDAGAEIITPNEAAGQLQPLPDGRPPIMLLELPAKPPDHGSETSPGGNPTLRKATNPNQGKGRSECH